MAHNQATDLVSQERNKQADLTLRVGRSLNDEKRRRMYQVLEEKTRRFRNHEDEIIQLRQKLTVKEKAKKALRTDIAKLRFALEVWPRVPIEIWRNIFAMVCVANPSYHYNIDRSTEPALLMPSVTLSHVCPHWRTIVLGTSELWTSIDIVLHRLSQGAIYLLRTVLERSKGQLLHIRLSSGDFALPDHADGLWEALFESSSHWKTLTLSLEDLGEFLEVLPNIPDAPFPNLVSFTSCADAGYIDEENWLWKALRGASKLRTVKITDVYPTFCLPYTQLTTLRLRTCPEGDSDDTDIMKYLFKVLSLCENLRRLTLEFIHWNSALLEDGDSYPNVELPCLHYLEIVDDGKERSVGNDFLFNSLHHMPVLDSFNLQCSSQNVLKWLDPLLSLLKRCSSLRRLSLRFTDFGDPGFRADNRLSDILQAAPNLTCLEIQARAPEQNLQADEVLFSFLSELKDTDKRRFLLPKLESLSIVRDGKASFYDFILANLLAIAKCRGPQQVEFPLKTVKLQRYVQRPGSVSTVGSNVIEDISALKQKGVSVLLEDLIELKDGNLNRRLV